jgi:hypothetical protein
MTSLLLRRRPPIGQVIERQRHDRGARADSSIQAEPTDGREAKVVGS